jgi:predicted amidohydrolase
LAIYQGPGPVGSAEAVQNNIDRLQRVVSEAKKFQAQIISFPELYLSGYALNTQLVQELAEPIDGPSLGRVKQIAREQGMAIICPYPERDSSQGTVRYYDSIAVIGADGSVLDNYRKTHLFGEAEKRNYSAGNRLPLVNQVAGFPVAVLNCYECEFPELYRILALRGAKLIVGPTAADYDYILANGSPTAVPYPDVSLSHLPAHAYMNHIFTAYSNRSGKEQVAGQHWRYRGNSIICGPHGDVILKAKPIETLMIADCIPGRYQPTHPEGNYFADRRPELYGDLTASKRAARGPAALAGVSSLRPASGRD